MRHRHACCGRWARAQAVPAVAQFTADTVPRGAPFPTSLRGRGEECLGRGGRPASVGAPCGVLSSGRASACGRVALRGRSVSVAGGHPRRRSRSSATRASTQGTCPPPGVARALAWARARTVVLVHLVRPPMLRTGPQHASRARSAQGRAPRRAGPGSRAARPCSRSSPSPGVGGRVGLADSSSHRSQRCHTHAPVLSRGRPASGQHGSAALALSASRRCGIASS